MVHSPALCDVYWASKRFDDRALLNLLDKAPELHGGGVVVENEYVPVEGDGCVCGPCLIVVRSSMVLLGFFLRDKVG